ncbi:heavy metal translocating P-type ATPase [Paracidobacterium acidisoli]|uniref:P-type Cu(2+) transporter n=1 Tax=Paracidobacterium acidisoli TaxID=2303751 RepID=A0A372IUB0_9BACT|nr:heavy metal translocating P-type ATPase [Paracidobacterium acidisoli]MBT9329955.1 heavy metal translocating P-type ATPase [Paracidobacterium acidisoli]
MAIAEKTAGKEEALILPVSGMTCAACQTHVERALRETPGVREASVSLMTHSARVVFDPSVAPPQKLIEAVREAGYEADLPRENASAASHGHEHSEEPSLKWKAIATLVAGAAVMAAGMHRTPFAAWLPERALDFITLTITTVLMVWAGGLIYSRAWRAALHRSTNMNTLVALGTGAAFVYSAAATLAPGYFHRHSLAAGSYYDSVLLILGFLLIGQWLDARAKRRTLDALHALMKLEAQSARVLRDGREVELPLAEVVPGDIVIVRPGDRIPVDGLILSGSTSVDESLITGESTPVLRAPGDRVIGGSLNYEGALEYRATSIGADSVLGQMMRLMEQAQSSKAPMQQLADRVSAVFVPIVLGLAALTFAVWMIFPAAHTGADAARALAVAITVLVIACPCAMGLAVPAALTVAVGRGAQLGVLFKGGESLERLARVDTVVFDKTGTITLGKPGVTALYPAAGVSEADLLTAAAAIEQRSEHPIAKAIVQAALERRLTLPSVQNVTAAPGRGVHGFTDGHQVAAGNAAFARELGAEIPETAGTPATMQGTTPGATRVFVCQDGRYLGSIEARDTLRPDAAEAVAKLQKMGLRVVMLTGDTRDAALTVAASAGIDEVFAGLLPDQKLEKIRELQSSGRRVAMIGDGINDAAALAQADAGIAVGTGADLAREAGDAILLSGEPLQMVRALLLARQAVRVMRQNLGWALGYNVVGIPVAAGVLWPAFGILLSPAIAAAAMALSSVSVLSNSLRLRSFEPQ